jgi:membrane protein YqaA with SNARE-associated domain
MTWLRDLATWMVGWAETPAGPMALFGLAVAEASVFPLPPDILLLALAVLRPEQSFLFAAICTVGSTLGGVLGYAMGRWGGRPLLKRFVSERKILAIERQFQRYDVWAVFVAGFTPIPYKVFAIGAGVFHLHVWRFVLATVTSRGLRFFLVGAVVFLFGEAAGRLIRDYFEVFTIAFVILLIGGFVILRWLGKGYAPSKSLDAS